MKQVRIDPRTVLEQRPFESRRHFGWRSRKARREAYAAWMTRHLSSLADFELEMKLLADCARRHELLEIPNGMTSMLMRKRLKQLRLELAQRAELGPDVFSARRKDLLAVVARIEERAELVAKVTGRPPFTAPVALPVDTPVADTTPAPASRKVVVDIPPAAAGTARGKRAADTLAPAAATSSRFARTARETRPR